MATCTPKKSNIWKHFTKLNAKLVECNLCKKQYVYNHGTGNFWTHLLNKHKITNPDSLYSVGVNASEKRDESQNQPRIDASIRGLKTYEKTSAKHQDITRKLAKLFIIEMIPLSKVNSAAWSEWAKSMDPRYELPDSTYLKTVIFSMYANARDVMKQKIKEVTYYSITCDTWTSKSNDGFIAVTAHGIDEEWNLKDYIIEVAHIEVRK